MMSVVVVRHPLFLCVCASPVFVIVQMQGLVKVLASALGTACADAAVSASPKFATVLLTLATKHPRKVRPCQRFSWATL